MPGSDEFFGLNVNATGTALEPLIGPGDDGVLGTSDDVEEDADGIVFLQSGLSNPLDLTMGPDGTLWIAEIGGNVVTVLAPTDLLLPGDTDADDDGLLNTEDPFVRDANNGTAVTVLPNETLLWNFAAGAESTTPGPEGYGGGLTGQMINGSTDYEAFLQEPSTRDGQVINGDNVKFTTAAGGGTTVIEFVSNGDPAETPNDGEYLFHTGVTIAETVETFTVTWTVINPAGDATGFFGTSRGGGPLQQLGGYIGTGDQSNYLKIVAIQDPNGEVQIALEDGDAAVGSPSYLQANDLFNVPDNATPKIFLEFTVDTVNATATPSVTYEVVDASGAVSGTNTVDGTAIDLTGTAVLDAILGNTTVNGQPTGLAVGLFSSNTGQLETQTFQAIFDDIEITATEQQIAPVATADAFRTGVDTVLTVPVADLLANDSDPNLADTITFAGVENAQNASVAVEDPNNTPADPNDDNVLITPASGFAGDAFFEYTITDPGGLTDSATVTVSVADETVLYRVNAGGGEVAADPADPLSSLAWAANTGGGAQSGTGFTVNTGQTSTHSGGLSRGALLPDYVPDAVFIPERWDPGAVPEMLWSFDVAAGGTYAVRLFMRNGFSGTDQPGERVFDVAIEDVEVFSDIDLSGQFGHLTGTMFEHTVTLAADDPTLDIEFLHQVENPLINAIEIVQLGTVPEPEPVVSIISGDQTVGEGDGQVQISLATDITVPSAETVDVTFEIVPGTATAGEDYSYSPGTLGSFDDTTGVYTDTVSIAGSSSDVTFFVDLLQDALEEGDESFTVNLISVTPNAQLGTSTTTVTIEDDDGPYTPPADDAFGVAVELSDDRLAPTVAGALSLGSNLLTATQEGENGTNGVRDRDYLTFTVPQGLVLSQLGLTAFVNDNPTDSQAFFAIDEGSEIFVDPVTGAVDAGGDPLLGAVIYNSGFVGTDLLAEMATNGGPQVDYPLPTFDTPLPAGDYTLWFNQGAGPSTATIDVVLAEAPSLTVAVAPSSIAENSGTAAATGTVTRSGSTAGDLVVSLASSDTTEATVPTSVTVLDGQASASFDITAVDDTEVDGTQTITLTATAADFLDGSTLLDVTDDEAPDETVLYRVNAGGPEIAAIDGDLAWTADTKTSNSAYLLSAGSNNTNGFSAVEPGATVASTTPGAIFDTERWDNSSAPSMQWAFPVTAGGFYDVRLFFGNGFSGTSQPGERVFDVAIEGAVPANLDDVDLSAQFGHQVGGMISNTVQVDDSSLDIEFLHQVENPLINGIEIVQLGAVPEPEPVVSIISGDQTVGEGDGQVQISLATDITVPSAETVDVTFEIVPGTATAGEDYSYSPGTLGSFDDTTGVYTDTVSIAGSSSDVTFLIDLLDDTLAENAESFTVNLIDVSSNATLGTSTASVAIEDNDSLTLEVSVDPTSISENCGTAIATVTRSGLDATLGDLEVSLASSDTSEAIVADPATVTIPDGQPSAEFTVATVDDAEADGDQTVTLTASATGFVDGTASLDVTDDDLVGAAEFSITLNSNNVQISNFGNNSFLVTNTGEKNIAKVELDVTNALYPDTVFDPFGVGGDTVAKLLQINTDGGTGVVAPDHGSEGSPGTTYIGEGGIAGFEGIQLLFDDAVDGGFNPDETLGFSVDMDPNSIAGATKSTLDSGAIPTWDVGGVSGAELIGSTYTVTFTDGTTATGQLHGNANQAGAKGLASEASPGQPVTLTVNGVGAGGIGAYETGGPSVIVNGPAGATARVVLTKGIIQPVENNFSEPYASQLASQLATLAASDFPANNAAEFQTVDVPLDGTGQEISSFFDFTQVPNYTLAVPEDQVPLGFVAGIIDPTNNDLPVGPVTAPIYLQYNDAPLPTVELSVDPTSAAEADETTLTLTATASAAVSGAQTVALALSGTAAAADFVDLDGDGVVVPDTITIADGATTGSVTVTVLDDPDDEGTETATFTIDSPSSGLALGTTTSVDVSISDNDTPLPIDVVLIDADNDTSIGPITAGASFAASELDGINLNVAGFVPATSPLLGEVESALVKRNGAADRIENVEPYSLFGDNSGDFNTGDNDLFVIGAGGNTTTFDLYSGNNLGGDLLESIAIEFTIHDDALIV